MSIPALVPGVSPEEYLLYEEAALDKHEYADGVIIPMPGGTYAHSFIKVDLLFLLVAGTMGQDVAILNSDIRVRTPDSRRYTYPDISVVAGTPINDPGWETATLTNPCLIVEVLSSSTRAYDMGEKFTGYRSVLTLREYLLVEQDRPLITQWVRQDTGQWVRTDHIGLDAVVELVSVPVTLPLRQVYRRVSFEKG